MIKRFAWKSGQLWPQAGTFRTTSGALLAAPFFVLASTGMAAASCVGIAALNTTVSDNVAGPPNGFTNPAAVTLNAGDALVFTVTRTAGPGGGNFFLNVTASPGGGQNGVVNSIVPNGVINFTANSSGSFTFQYELNAILNTETDSVSVTCNGSGGGSSASDAASGADSEVRTGDAGRLPTTPGSFPDPANDQPPSLVSEIDRRINIVIDQLDAIDATLEEVITEISDYERNPPVFTNLADAAENLQYIQGLERERNRLRDERAQLTGELNDLNDRRSQALSEDFTPQAPLDLGDAESLQRQAISPVFVSSKSRPTGGASSLWTRLKITGLNGTLGRSGVAIHGQAGLVWPTATGGSVGTFASLFRSNTSSTTLGTNTVSLGIGTGGYYKFPINSKLDGGVSVTFERSTNNIISGGTTGNFTRDLATIDASISSTRQRGLVTWTPSANLGYTYSNRHAYTDSAATAVAGRIDQTLVASAGLNGSRTIVLSGKRARLVTINGGATVSANLSGASSLAFTSGTTVTNSAWSVALNGGATWQMKNGGTLGLSAAIGGIGAGVQSYTGAITYSLKF